jgi:crotonobetainyl-CoA:carnitine CoA-transferase CaiB-like acyl-CoA transferase
MKEIKYLERIRILDFTRLLPGPLGTPLLCEMGEGTTNLLAYKII